MLEWLKTILGDAYTEEIDKKVSEEIGKSFVARTDFNTVNTEKKALADTVKERDKQLETLKASTGDVVFNPQINSPWFKPTPQRAQRHRSPKSFNGTFS